MTNVVLIILFVTLFLILVLGVSMYFVITRLYRKLRKSEAEAIESIITAQERERAIISREVHDNMSPMLSITQMQIGYLLEQTNDSLQQELLTKAKLQVLDSIKQCRNISHMISSEVSPSKSFQLVLSEQVAFINELGNISVKLTIDKTLPPLDTVKGTSLIRVFQELMMNTIRHASATQIEIRIEQTAGHIYLVYSDNGNGFQIGTVIIGLGIQNINKRVEIIGGKTLWNEPESANGMNVQMMIPLQKITA